MAVLDQAEGYFLA